MKNAKIMVMVTSVGGRIPLGKGRLRSATFFFKRLFVIFLSIPSYIYLKDCNKEFLKDYKSWGRVGRSTLTGGNQEGNKQAKESKG